MWRCKRRGGVRATTAIAGLAQWLTCEKAPKAVALAQLDVCRTCPTAQVRRLGPLWWLSCGEPGEETLGVSCGCVCGKLSPADARRIAAIEDPLERRLEARKAMRPWGKTGCVTACPQLKWDSRANNPQSQ